VQQELAETQRLHPQSDCGRRRNKFESQITDHLKKHLFIDRYTA
jgi:hypothetical protein